MFSVRETASEQLSGNSCLTPLIEDAVPTAGCFTSLQADRFHFEREQNRSSEFLIEEYFLFENRMYGKGISSGKYLARLSVKTFNDSLLAPEV